MDMFDYAIGFQDLLFCAKSDERTIVARSDFYSGRPGQSGDDSLDNLVFAELAEGHWLK
jgi:hypothetical protein